jgi:hypothetical protein
MLCGKVFILLLLDDGLGELAGEVFSGDVGDDGVEVLALASVFALLGDLTGDEDANALGNALNTAGPEEVVEAGVDAVILGAHEGVGELADLLNGSGGALVEGAALQVLADVDGALVGDGVGLAVSLAGGGAAGDTTAGDLLDGSEVVLLGGGELSEDALPAVVVLLGASEDGLAAGGNGSELGFLAENLTLVALLDHFCLRSSFLGVEKHFELLFFFSEIYFFSQVVDHFVDFRFNFLRKNKKIETLNQHQKTIFLNEEVRGNKSE